MWYYNTRKRERPTVRRKAEAPRGEQACELDRVAQSRGFPLQKKKIKKILDKSKDLCYNTNRK
jgi:hypothetical protein